MGIFCSYCGTTGATVTAEAAATGSDGAVESSAIAAAAASRSSTAAFMAEKEGQFPPDTGYRNISSGALAGIRARKPKLGRWRKKKGELEEGGGGGKWGRKEDERGGRKKG